jgi:hypothetical protein
MARQMRSGVAGIGTSVTPSGARASRIAFITVGVDAHAGTARRRNGFARLRISFEPAPAS